jgi:hypothetical protein
MQEAMRIRSTHEISGRAVALVWVLAIAALSSLRKASRGAAGPRPSLRA